MLKNAMRAYQALLLLLLRSSFDSTGISWAWVANPAPQRSAVRFGSRRSGSSSSSSSCPTTAAGAPQATAARTGASPRILWDGMRQQSIRVSLCSPLYSKKKRGGGGVGSAQDSSSDDRSSSAAAEFSSSASASSTGSTRSTLQLAKSLVDSSATSGNDEATAISANEANAEDSAAAAEAPTARTTMSSVVGRDRRDNGSARQLAMLSADDVDDEAQVYGAVDSRFASAGADTELQGRQDDPRVQLAWSSTAASDLVGDGSADEASTGDEVVLGLGEAGDEVQSDEEELRQQQQDDKYMRMAVQMAQSVADSAYPHPPVGAVLVDTTNGDVLGIGASEQHCYHDAIRVCLQDAGLDVTPLKDWLVAWPSDRALREALSRPTTTLYVTLEPSKERSGQAFPALTNLIQQAGIGQVVIGCVDPIPERTGKGAAALHAAGIQVRLLPAEGPVQQECQDLIEEYSGLANSKLHVQARTHFELFGRPLGFLHCSVVDSDNIEAFQRAGNAFGTKFGGTTLSFRNFGAYEIAPPPEVIWAAEDSYEASSSSPSSTVDQDLISVDFEDEDYQGDLGDSSPMMPWYEQANAVVATFPRPGNGPANDKSLAARLNGLKWLATHGRRLPGGVERILVMDATDLKDLPLTNQALAAHFPHSSIDVESFWRGDDFEETNYNRNGAVRRPTRVLLRRGAHAQAQSAAAAAAVAAQAAAKAAQLAADALETGNAAQAAEAALEMERSANSHAQYVQSQLQTLQELRLQLEKFGVVVETIQGGEPVDVMKHLGDRNGYRIVVWRAGCWGDRGVKSILAGAFQWVSAHLAVDAVGGKFWQLMLAENAVQAACGPHSKVKVFADQEDISLEYCDNPDVDTDCNLLIAGRPVRHIRLDCRIALVDEKRHREFVVGKTKKLDRKIIEEEAPWFL